MLSSQYRFHGHKSLGFVFRNGVSARSARLLVRVHKHPHRSDSRAAVVVSKKISKRAVVRNRIRRRIYETLRTDWQAIGEPHDMVFTVLTIDVATIPADDLRQELRSLLRQGQASFLKKNNYRR